MQQTELTREYLDELRDVIARKDEQTALAYLEDLHAADIAEIYDAMSMEEAKYLYLLLDGNTAATVLSELEADDLERFLQEIPSKVLAKQFIDNMNSDDAADVLGMLPDDKQERILSLVKEHDHAGAILDLLNYDEDTAGGLMAKELISVNENWTVMTCMKEMGKQAEDIEEIYYIYVTDNNNRLKGILPLKNLLIAEQHTRIAEIYNEDIIYVKADENAEEVGNIMDKYDLVALPVVDSLDRLIGRITIDDVVDVIREEAERDYSMASGIYADVEPSDTVWHLTKARLPWLILGLIGGIFGARVIEGFEAQLAEHAVLAFFIPLIGAMGGNVGVQSSSIVVQSLASNTLGFDSTFRRIAKEFAIALLNGLVCAALIFGYNYFFSDSFALTVTVSFSLFVVIVFASVFGTFVPLMLHKTGADPAYATGPFITTINDILGLLIYMLTGHFMFNLFPV